MILKYFKEREWGLAVICVFLITIQVYLELRIPGYMSSITMTISTGGTTDEVLDEGMGMVLCAFGSLLFATITGFIASYISASLSMRLRTMQFDRVQSYSMKEMNKFSTASLITRSTNDVNQIQMIVARGLQTLIRAPILAVWATLKIINNSWQWTAATALAIIVMVSLLSIMMFFVFPRFKKMQWLTDNINSAVSENLSGVRVVRAYNAEEHQEQKFEKANDELTKTNLFTTRSMSILAPSMSAVMSLLSLSIYWIGAIIIQASSGNHTEQLILFSDMIVFSSYAMMIVSSFIMTVMIFMFLPRAIVSSKRVQEVIDTEPSIKDGKMTEGLKGRCGEIEFKDVSFRYSDSSDYVLKNIDISVKKGDTVAFIGSTGSGKSTLVNLIPRFYDVTEGSVTIDGVDVRDYTLEALHRKIGYISQKAVIFTGTVDENVRYGDTSDDHSEDDVKHAIDIAQGKRFVEDMEKGYMEHLYRGGKNISGGQKQRISIARAVCRSPEIYIFDDTFSALDYKTDKALRNTLKKEVSRATVIIVTQRIGTIMDADQIIVIEDGQIVGKGKHEDLIRECPTYLEIASSQLSQEELGI